MPPKISDLLKQDAELREAKKAEQEQVEQEQSEEKQEPVSKKFTYIGEPDLQSKVKKDLEISLLEIFNPHSELLPPEKQELPLNMATGEFYNILSSFVTGNNLVGIKIWIDILYYVSTAVKKETNFESLIRRYITDIKEDNIFENDDVKALLAMSLKDIQALKIDINLKREIKNTKKFLEYEAKLNLKAPFNKLFLTKNFEVVEVASFFDNKNNIFEEFTVVHPFTLEQLPLDLFNTRYREFFERIAGLLQRTDFYKDEKLETDNFKLKFVVNYFSKTVYLTFFTQKVTHTATGPKRLPITSQKFYGIMSRIIRRMDDNNDFYEPILNRILFNVGLTKFKKLVSKEELEQLSYEQKMQIAYLHSDEKMQNEEKVVSMVQRITGVNREELVKEGTKLLVKDVTGEDLSLFIEEMFAENAELTSERHRIILDDIEKLERTIRFTKIIRENSEENMRKQQLDAEILRLENELRVLKGTDHRTLAIKSIAYWNQEARDPNVFAKRKVERVGLIESEKNLNKMLERRKTLMDKWVKMGGLELGEEIKEQYGFIRALDLEIAEVKRKIKDDEKQIELKIQNQKLGMLDTSLGYQLHVLIESQQLEVLIERRKMLNRHLEALMFKKGSISQTDLPIIQLDGEQIDRNEAFRRIQMLMDYDREQLSRINPEIMKLQTNQITRSRIAENADSIEEQIRLARISEEDLAMPIPIMAVTGVIDGSAGPFDFLNDFDFGLGFPGRNDGDDFIGGGPEDRGNDDDRENDDDGDDMIEDVSELMDDMIQVGEDIIDGVGNEILDIIDKASVAMRLIIYYVAPIAAEGILKIQDVLEIVKNNKLIIAIETTTPVVTLISYLVYRAFTGQASPNLYTTIKINTVERLSDGKKVIISSEEQKWNGVMIGPKTLRPDSELLAGSPDGGDYGGNEDDDDGDNNNDNDEEEVYEDISKRDLEDLIHENKFLSDITSKIDNSLVDRFKDVNVAIPGVNDEIFSKYSFWNYFDAKSVVSIAEQMKDTYAAPAYTIIASTSAILWNNAPDILKKVGVTIFMAMAVYNVTYVLEYSGIISTQLAENVRGMIQSVANIGYNVISGGLSILTTVSGVIKDYPTYSLFLIILFISLGIYIYLK